MAEVDATTRLAVYEMCGGSCAKCHVELNPFPGEPNSLEVDHIISRSHGGPDDLWNLQPLCARCSRSRDASDSSDYRPPTVRRKYDAQRERWVQSQSRPQSRDRSTSLHQDPQIQPEGSLLVPEGSGSVTTLPDRSFGWKLRWRYPWMGNSRALVVVFWAFFFWIAIIWAIAWLLFKVVEPRNPRTNRYLAFDATAQRRYTIGCIVAAAALFFLIVRLTPSADENAAVNSPTVSIGSEATESTAGSEMSDSTIPAAASTTLSTTPATTASGEFEYLTEGAVVGVANASRINGGAGLLTDSLAAVGYTTTEPTNSSDDVADIETTQLFYAPGDPAAQAVAENLRVAFDDNEITVEERAVPAPTESGNLGDATVLVLMGNDIAGRTLEELRPPAPTNDRATNDGDDAATTDPPETSPPETSSNVFYQNCDAVRAAGAAPIRPEDPGWETKFDRDGDGVGCE